MSGLGEYIDSLTQAGELDSEGDITVNVLKAQKKLGSHQLAGPHHYVLPFLSAATLSKATVADFSGDYRNLTLDFDGVPLEAFELERCLGETEGRGAEIALGLRAAEAVKAGRLTVASAVGDQVNVLTVKGGQPELLQLSRSQVRIPLTTRIEVRAAELRSDLPSLWSFLGEVCKYSPIVCVNGRRSSFARLQYTPGLLRLISPHFEDPAVSSTAWTVGKAEHPHCSGHVWMTESNSSRVQFVLNGVTYPAAAAFLRYSGLNAVLSTPEIQLDISRSAVIVNDTVTRLLRSVESLFEESLLPKVLKEYRSMMAQNRKVAKPYLRAWIPRADKRTAERLRKITAN